eukprot:jgi/Bigna1/82205/fgenesh1_pg.89_\
MDSLLARLWLRIAILSFGLSVGTAYQVQRERGMGKKIEKRGASIGSAPIPTYADVTKLVASEGAFASLTAHGAVYPSVESWIKITFLPQFSSQEEFKIHKRVTLPERLCCDAGLSYIPILKKEMSLDDGSYFLWYGVSSRSNSFVTKSFQIEASNDVKRIVSNKGSKPAFAVLLTNGSLLTFGERLYGGDVDYPFTGKSVYLRSKKLTQITAILGAFAGLTDTGEIIVWGSGAYDNLQSLDVLENQQFLFISIESNTESFAAIRNDSKILGWGWTTSPRDPRISPSSPPLPATAATVRKLFHTEYAFAALMSDGSVITWGRIFYGADSSSVSSQLNANVSDIFTTSRAFAALRHDNTVVTWGHTESGGDSSSVQHLLRNITTIASTSQSFCALSDSGMAVAWGSAHTGGSCLYRVSRPSSNVCAEFISSLQPPLNSGTEVVQGAGNLFVSERESVCCSIDSQQQGGDLGRLSIWYLSCLTRGNSSSVKQRLTWVGDVVPTLYAFAALDSTTKAPTTTNAPATDRPTGAPLSLAPSCGPSSSQPTSSPSTHVPTATPLTSMPTFSPTTSSPTQDYLHGLEVSSNLKEVSSHDDVARVTDKEMKRNRRGQRDVHRNHTVLKSSLLTSIAKGYIGVKIWQYSPSGQQKHMNLPHILYAYPVQIRRAVHIPVEYRGPLSESSSNFEAIQDGGEGMGPYVITWVDPTGPAKAYLIKFHKFCVLSSRALRRHNESMGHAAGVVRAMRPTFNDSLLTLTKSSIEEGTSHSMNGVWRLFRTYIQAVIALFAVAMLLLMFSCVKIYQRNIRNKMQYALDVTGYRISLESDGYSMPTPSKDGKKKINETQLEVLHQDRLRWYHWLYIALVFGFQGALALLFTMSFMGMLFLAVNKEHFDILKQYPEFAVKRDSQLSGVVDAIEAAYRNETSRIDSTYFAKQHGCLAADAAIWSAYENNKTAVKAFHNLQFQTPPKGASKFDEISSEKACNLKGGAIYEKDSIAYNYKDPTSHEIVTWHLDPKSDEEKIMANLSEWCGNADWCRGYSFDRSNQHYYLFQKLPSPHIPTNEGANGTCFVILNDAWPSFDEVTGNLSKARKKYLGEYQQEVNRDVRDLNRYQSTHGAWTTTFQSEAILTVPNLPTHVPEPLLKQVLSQETNVSATRIPSRSNQSLKLNDQMGLETVNVSSMVLPRLQDYIEYPQWRFSGAVLLKMLLALILLFDISWVIIRWFRILISTAQYVIGVRIKLKDSNVGKPDQFLFDLICKKLLCCGCLHSIHKCCLRIDEFVWELFYKMWKVFMAASIAFVLYILYYVTRQVVTVKTVGAFGVFQGMTLQQEIQRTIRNDEITAKANSKNAHGHATFTIGLHRSAARIRNDQYEFNLNEKARVDNWNSKYCATASEYALGIHELQLTKLQNLSTTVTSGRGSASLPLSAFAIESGTFGIDAYDIHSVAITWETDSVSSAPSSVNLAYRIGLAMGPLETNSNGSIIIITNHNIKYSPTITVLQQQQQRNKQRHVQRFKGVKATFMIIEVLSTANTQRGSYSIGDISVSGRGDAQSFRCPKVSWKQLDFNPNLYLGDCQRLDPIHGHMMRIWNRYEWTTDLKEVCEISDKEGGGRAHAPFIDAVRSIVLSPFIILMFGVVTYVGVQVTIALLEYVLILAGMVRKHTYVEVPAVLVQTTVVEAVAEEKTEKDSGILKKSPRSDKSEDNDSIRREATFSRNQSSAWRSSRRLSFGSNKSKDIAMLGGLHSRRVSESFAISSVRPHLDRSTSQRSSGEATYRSDKSRDIAMMELNSGMNQSLRTSSPNRSMLGRASSPNRSVLASGRCKRIDLHMSGQDQSV